MTVEKGSKVLKYSDVIDRCTSFGYKPDQINEAIEEFEELNVLQVNTSRTKITFV